MNDWIINEPADYYHEQSKSGRCMSSHMLADFRKSPKLYRKKVLGEVEEKSSEVFAMGTMTHKLILEGRNAFDEEYIIDDGPINERTGEPFGKTTKAYQAWQCQKNKLICSTEDFVQINKYYASVMSNQDATRLLSIGSAEGVARADLFDVPCQIRMDWFNPQEGLVDLKTCAELRFFEADVRRYGYIHQLAFYRAVIRKLTGKTVDVYIIAVEKTEPFAAGVWLVTPEVLEQADMILEATLSRYKTCCSSGLWPTGYENIRILDEL